MSRLTKKQRLKLKRAGEADHKAFMRRGEIRREQDAARDAAIKVRTTERTENPRERHHREQREREAARLAERRAEHQVAEGRRWVVATACVGRESELVSKLRESRIPYFRAQDDIVQILPSGRPRKLSVPVLARTIFVGVEDRDHLARLGREFPWLMERIPGRRFGRVGDQLRSHIEHARFGDASIGDAVDKTPPESFPWLVDRLEHLTASGSGNLAVVTALIPEAQMRLFADRLIGAAPLLDASVSFEIGELVRVSDGPFASFNGSVEAFDQERGKLKVAVSIFGRTTPVELEFNQVERG